MSKQLHQIVDLIRGFSDSVGLAIAHYFTIWNIRRFAAYFGRNPNFPLVDYFTQLGKQLGEMKGELARYSSMRLLKNCIEEDEVKQLFQKVENVLRDLGIKQNEPVGTIKVLHMFTPYYFPLLDNEIASSLGLVRKGSSISASEYVEWMRKLKSWLQNYGGVAEKLERNLGGSILKLVDEGLYIMCSVDLGKRVKLLGIR